jgi:hypothetical protein
MATQIECSFNIDHSLVFSRLKHLLDGFECDWYSDIEVSGSSRTRAFTRKHYVITILCYDTIDNTRHLFHELLKIKQMNVETWFDLKKNKMIYANSYYRKTQCHKAFFSSGTKTNINHKFNPNKLLSQSLENI